MDIPIDVFNEIKRHNLDTFKILDATHYGVLSAIEFLEQNGYEDMGMRLRRLTREGCIRKGPLEGIVAVGALVSEREFVLLSDRFPEYLTTTEIMISLVSEVGCLSDFNLSAEVNEARSQKALEWMKNRLNHPDHSASILTKAVMKAKGKSI